MTSWTVHVRDGAEPRLIPERFSLGALVFGPLWLLAAGAWIPAILVACAWAATALLAPAWASAPISLGMAWFCGLMGRDLVRWSLARRGWHQAHVVVAASEEAALARLLAAEPLTSLGFLPPGAARPQPWGAAP